MKPRWTSIGKMSKRDRTRFAVQLMVEGIRIVSGSTFIISESIAKKNRREQRKEGKGKA